ncbi:MAG: alpha/beta fold hydrolase [Chitinivibrionales bacterium]|nr:alpha/beta fold hydrolase [Chitinivibrionales bacterium]
MIFVPQPSSYRDSPEILKIATDDSVRISAVYLPAPDAPVTIIYSHGNADDIGNVGPFADRLRFFGVSVLAYDYRGYGTSEGQPSVQGTYRDISAVYRYVTDTLGVAPERIVLWGHSVGSGPSVWLAAHHKVGGLVLESAFTGAFKVVTRVALLPFDMYDNLGLIRSVHCPVLVIHGRKDLVIPIRHGKALYERAQQPKSSIWLADCGHNDVLICGGERFRTGVRDFLEGIESQ